MSTNGATRVALTPTTWLERWSSAVLERQCSLVAQLLRDRCAIIDASLFVTGETALHYATRQDDFLLVAFLLRHGANINAISERNETALMIAVQRADTLLVYLLLHNGALVSLPNDMLAKRPLETSALANFKSWLTALRLPAAQLAAILRALEFAWRRDFGLAEHKNFKTKNE